MNSWSPSAPKWVWSLAIKPGAWRVLMALWSFADHGAEGESTIYPGRATVADRLGITVRTLRTQLVWLSDEGWIRSEPGYKKYQLALRLAWMSPFSSEHTPIPETDAPRPKSGPYGSENSDEGSAMTQPIRSRDATDPPKRKRSSAKPDQVITHTSQPHNYPTVSPHSPPEQASFALKHPEPPDRVCELRALHERLAIEAHRHLGHEPVNGRVPGTLPKPGTKANKALEKRIAAAISEHGYDVCVALIEWRAATEWRHRPEQLARAATQSWAPGSLTWALAKLDAGVDHEGKSMRRQRYDNPLPPEDPDDPWAGLQAHEIERIVDMEQR